MECQEYDLVVSSRRSRKTDTVPKCPLLMFKPAFAWDQGKYYQNPPGWDFTRGMFLDSMERVLEGRGQRRAVVIDDEISIRNALKTMLERFGFEVAVWSERKAELELFQESTVDLVLMDVNMPGISWQEFSEELKRVSPETLIFLATGERDTELEDTISGVLYKPFGLGEVAEIAGQVLKVPSTD